MRSRSRALEQRKEEYVKRRNQSEGDSIVETAMEIRFVGAKKQDSATVRQRLLQANRTRNYRNRQKARKDTATTNHQAELLSDAIESVAENGLSGLENNSFPDTGGFEDDDPVPDTEEFEEADLLPDAGEFEENNISPCDIFTISSQEVDDPIINTIEPHPYYEEEPVDLYSAEEHKDQRQPQSPHIHAEERADLANYHANTDHILAPKIDGETTELTPDQWQALFSGSATQNFDGKPKQACLHVERAPQTPPVISFDVDSLLGFVDSPAAAIHGIRFYSAPQYRQNIQTDVHLTFDHVAPDIERPRLLPSRLKDVPHFTFAKVEGADFITLHLFFPHLPCRRDFYRLTDEQFSRWFDDIFYPAVRQVYGVDRLQHLPASYRHALATCRAPQVEDRLLETPSYRTQLQMSYFLPPHGLNQLWDHVLTAVRQPGLQDFRDPELFIEAKGTKLLFKYPDAPSDLLAVMENFDYKLHRVLDFSCICSDRLYVDVGKETCPLHSDPGTQVNSNPSPEAQTYLWRRCCIRHHLSELYDGNIPKSGQNFYHESMLRDAGGMTTLTPPSSRLRRGGILYGQMYSLTKEIIDAARTFPFQNPDLRHMALDPQLRHGVQNIYGKPTSGQSITDRAYMASKRRCHYGLTDSKQRYFGVREEYRISWTLFQSALTVLRSLTPETRSIKLPGRPPYLWAVRSPVFVDFVWRNINKFTTGFELVRAQCSPGLTTWEQTKMMDVFLRCLRVAVGGHDYSREGALWWSRRELPQPVGSPQVRYGLGFGQTLEQYGYCWIEPLIDWALLRFLPDITDSVLFGNGTLQQRYLKCGGHVKHFFDLSRRAYLGLEWLRRYPREAVITDQIVSWLCHICLRQMRVDVLHSIQRDLRPGVRTVILDDGVHFCRKGLSAALINGMTAVSGNHANFKSPQEAAQALFGFNDGRLRDHWENKPFRKLYQWICAALQHFPAERRLSQVFARRLQCYLFAYHWVLPYPSPGGLAPRTKDGKRRWFSIDIQGEIGLTVENASSKSWCWARTRWRPGYPAPVPQYLDWSQDQWQSWIDRHIGQALPYEAWEPCRDQENLVSSTSEKSSGIRRNPLRSTRHSVIQDSRNGRDINSSISNPSGVGSEAHILTSARVVIPSQLQPEYDFQLYQQVERHITSFRKQIACGCGQAFKSQQVTMPRAIHEAKAAADVERRRRRPHANLHNPVFPILPLQLGGGARRVNVFSGSYSSANPTDAPEPDNTDL
ncbi:uncharacterized protein AUP68_10982 [Ilyonectria robusta]